MNKIKGIIFDMDGVLIDSEKEYLKLFQGFLKEQGKVYELEELRCLAGASGTLTDDYLYAMLQIPKEITRKRLNRYFDENMVDFKKIFRKEALDVLNHLQQKQIKLALASSSSRKHIEEVLKTCQTDSFFEIVVSGKEFKQSKPNPEIYEFTVHQIGISKQELLVIEDSTYGILAAKRAGLCVIALKDPLLKFDVSKADYTIDSLSEIMSFI